MTSKHLYFRLMKADARSRIWAVALVGLACFFAYPVSAMFMAGEIKHYTTLEAGLQNYQKSLLWWLGPENGFTVFGMMMGALICGLSSFSYLNTRSKVDFYHSIPVRREKLYLANYLNGILILAIPYAMGLLLSVAVGTVNGLEAGLLMKTVISAGMFHLVYFILNYATVIIAVMMTGNLVVSFLGSMVFFAFVPAAVTVVTGYFSTFFKSYRIIYVSDLMNRGMRISPMAEYIYQMNRWEDKEPVFAAAGAALAISVILAVAGCMLYRRRASESAGKAMAFAISKPWIRLAVSFFSALAFGLFFWIMRQSTGWGVFGIVCGAVISHCVIEIIYHFDFKKLFSNKGQLAVCTLLTVAVFMIFRYDLTGYDRYIPAAGKVKEAALYVDALSGWVSCGEVEQLNNGTRRWVSQGADNYALDTMHYGDVETVREVAAAGVEAIQEQKASDRNLVYTETQEAKAPARIDSEPVETMSRVIIRYILTSGRSIYRSYDIPLSRIDSQLERLCGDEAYLKGAFPLKTREASEIASISYLEQEKNVVLDSLTEQEKRAIMESYLEEFAGLTPDRMQVECPVGLIRFTTQQHEEGLRWGRQREEKQGYHSWELSDMENRDYYPVYPSFQNTLAMLRRNGVPAGEFKRNLDVRSIRMHWYSGRGRYDWQESADREVTFTDPAQIHQLLADLNSSSGVYYNRMYRTSQVEAELMYAEDGTEKSLSMYFPYGSVPEFVKERLE